MPFTKDLEELLACPITAETMQIPAMYDNHTFNKAAIEQWWGQCVEKDNPPTNPYTGEQKKKTDPINVNWKVYYIVKMKEHYDEISDGELREKLLEGIRFLEKIYKDHKYQSGKSDVCLKQILELCAYVNNLTVEQLLTQKVPELQQLTLAEFDKNLLLLVASASGDTTVISNLINGTDIKRKNIVNFSLDPGITPLFAAAQSGASEVMKILIKNGANVDVKDDRGRTPLFAAIQSGNMAAIQTLIDAGADVNVEDAQSVTPLDIAMLYENDNIIVQLKNAGARPKVVGDVEVDREGNTPLHQAVKRIDLEAVRRLVSQGADIKISNKHKNTPLHTAVNYYDMQPMHVEIFKELLKAINVLDVVNVSNNDGYTPLHFAAFHGIFTVVEDLVKKGADIDAKNENYETPLYIAAQRGMLNTVKTLIEKGAAIDAKCNTGETPLCVAAMYGHVEIVKALIKNKARLDYPFVDNYGNTPLHIAAQQGHIKIIEVLIKAGGKAAINVVNYNGDTPLHAAVKAGNLEMVKAFIKNGAIVDVRNNDGKTALDVARQYENQYETRAEYQSVINLLEAAAIKLEGKSKKPSVLFTNVAVIKQGEQSESASHTGRGHRRVVPAGSRRNSRGS